MMKGNSCFRWLVLTIVFLSFVGCQKLSEEDEALQEPGIPLKIKARSSDAGKIDYPLYLYAFNEKGACTVSQTVASSSESIELSLPEGDYRIVAISGLSDSYDIPENPTIDDVITLKGVNGANVPLMIGKADVVIGHNKKSSLDITLGYAVAAVNVSLSNLPSDVSAVRFSLSPLYSSLSLGGTYGGKTVKMEADCKLNTENMWTAKTVYVFPGKESETVFSIVLTMKDGSVDTYGYTYAGIPEAGRPFNINGSYSGGFTVSGSVVGGNWGLPIDVRFDFGSNNLSEEEGSEDDEEAGDDIPDLPEVGEIWNGTIVAAINETTSLGTELLLLSLEEWEITTSEVEEVTDGYIVNDMDKWRLPTYDEALLLRKNFTGENRKALNERIAEYDDTLYGIDGEERYLCDKDGSYYSFIFSAGTSVTQAGNKRSYYVRLVKSILY